jgi:hypothetical protein
MDEKGNILRTSGLSLFVITLGLFIVLSQLTDHFLQTLFLVLIGTLLLKIRTESLNLKALFKGSKFLFALSFFVFIIFRLSKLTKERLIEGLDHDNIFHFYAIVNKTIPMSGELPPEFNYLPMGWHKSVSQVFELFNLDKSLEYVIPYFIVGIVSVALFLISIIGIFQTLINAKDLKGKKFRARVLSWSLVIVTGWGLWLYWVGSIPYLFSLAFAFFGISELLKIIFSETNLSDRRTHVYIAIVTFAAAAICWPPIAIVIGVIVIVFQWKFRIIQEFSRYIPLAFILSLPIAKSLLESRSRFTTKSYPLFASDGVSGIGEFQLLPLVVVIAIIASGFVKIPQKQIPRHDLLLIKLILFFVFIGTGVALGIELIFGITSGSNTRYYAQKVFFPVGLLILITLISIFIRNSEQIVKNSPIRKIGIFGALFLCTLSVSFPWGTPEWGLPNQGPTSSTTTTSLAAGSRQIYHHFYGEQAIRPLVNGSNLLQAVNIMEMCRIPSRTLYLDLTLDARDGAGVYGNYWLAALKSDPSIWDLAKSYNSESDLTLDSMQRLPLKDLELLKLGARSFLVISKSGTFLLKTEKSVNSKTDKEIEKCLGDLSKIENRM